jgi:hypothetical protein
MSVLQIIGWLMILAPFVAIFGLVTKTEGFKVAAMIHAICATVFSVLYVGIRLAELGG